MAGGSSSSSSSSGGESKDKDDEKSSSSDAADKAAAAAKAEEEEEEEKAAEKAAAATKAAEEASSDSSSGDTGSTTSGGSSSSSTTSGGSSSSDYDDLIAWALGGTSDSGSSSAGTSDSGSASGDTFGGNSDTTEATASAAETTGKSAGGDAPETGAVTGSSDASASASALDALINMANTAQAGAANTGTVGTSDDAADGASANNQEVVQQLLAALSGAPYPSTMSAEGALTRAMTDPSVDFVNPATMSEDVRTSRADQYVPVPATRGATRPEPVIVDTRGTPEEAARRAEEAVMEAAMDDLGGLDSSSGALPEPVVIDMRDSAKPAVMEAAMDDLGGLDSGSWTESPDALTALLDGIGAVGSSMGGIFTSNPEDDALASLLSGGDTTQNFVRPEGPAGDNTADPLTAPQTAEEAAAMAGLMDTSGKSGLQEALSGAANAYTNFFDRPWEELMPWPNTDTVGYADTSWEQLQETMGLAEPAAEPSLLDSIGEFFTPQPITQEAIDANSIIKPTEAGSDFMDWGSLLSSLGGIDVNGMLEALGPKDNTNMTVAGEDPGYDSIVDPNEHQRRADWYDAGYVSPAVGNQPNYVAPEAGAVNELGISYSSDPNAGGGVALGEMDPADPPDDAGDVPLVTEPLDVPMPTWEQFQTAWGTAPTEAADSGYTVAEGSPIPADYSGDRTNTTPRDVVYAGLMEAGGEGDDGMLATYAAIINRTQSGDYSSDPVEVVNDDWQFSSFNDPEDGGFTDEYMQEMYPPGGEAYNHAAELYQQALAADAAGEDPTGGAQHFLNPSVPETADEVKNFADKGYEAQMIGNHMYFVPPGGTENAAVGATEALGAGGTDEEDASGTPLYFKNKKGEWVDAVTREPYEEPEASGTDKIVDVIGALAESSPVGPIMKLGEILFPDFWEDSSQGIKDFFNDGTGNSGTMGGGTAENTAGGLGTKDAAAAAAAIWGEGGANSQNPYNTWVGDAGNDSSQGSGAVYYSPVTGVINDYNHNGIPDDQETTAAANPAADPAAADPAAGGYGNSGYQTVWPGADYSPGNDPEWDYYIPYAQGGPVGMPMEGLPPPPLAATAPKASPNAVAPSGGMDPRLVLIADAEDALTGQHPNPQQALQAFIEAFGESALKRLREQVLRGQTMRNQPRMVSGQEGVDQIPARIDNVQEARLSDGEFVMTADAVRNAGGGNRKAGAEKLMQLNDVLSKRPPGPLNVEKVGR